MILIVLGTWAFLAVVAAVVFAALGRAGLQEEREEARQLEWLHQVTGSALDDDGEPIRPASAALGGRRG
jgi:hypothetical protein